MSKAYVLRVVCDGETVIDERHRQLAMLIEKRLEQLGKPVTARSVTSYLKSLILQDVGR